MAEIDVDARIEELLTWLDEAKAVPFSTSVMVHRDTFAEELLALRDELPQELRQARLIIDDRNEVLDAARRESERIVEAGRQERDRLVAESEVVRAAERRADELITAARADARRMRVEADDYIDGRLAAFEITLHKTLATVERGRARLAERVDHGDPPVHVEAGATAEAGFSVADEDGPSLFDHEQG